MMMSVVTSEANTLPASIAHSKTASASDDRAEQRGHEIRGCGLIVIRGPRVSEGEGDLHGADCERRVRPEPRSCPQEQKRRLAHQEQQEDDLVRNRVRQQAIEDHARIEVRQTRGLVVLDERVLELEVVAKEADVDVVVEELGAVPAPSIVDDQQSERDCQQHQQRAAPQAASDLEAGVQRASSSPRRPTLVRPIPVRALNQRHLQRQPAQGRPAERRHYRPSPVK